MKFYDCGIVISKDFILAEKHRIVAARLLFVLYKDFTLGRVLVLVDGFNCFHRLDDYQEKYNECVKWLNYKSLIESYLTEEDKLNIKVIYFSAIAEYRPIESQNKHHTYIEALKKANIEIVLGTFKEKYIRPCWCCNLSLSRNDLKRHEEKNTDVNIAIKLIEMTIYDQYDKCFILSSDNDFSSAIQRAKELSPYKQIIVCPPPLAFKNPRKAIYFVKELKEKSGQNPLFIGWDKIKKHQFEDNFGFDELGNEIKNPWQITKVNIPQIQN